MTQWWNTKREQDRLLGMQVLARGLVERPGVYGVSPQDAAEALRLVEALTRAVDVASNPATRTQLATAAKNEAMETAHQCCLRLIRFIRVNPNLSDADRAAIGVPPAVTERRRVPPPTTRPILAVCGVVPGGHEVEIFDEAAPDRRGKPRDARGLELFVAYSANHGDGGLKMEQIIKTAVPHGVLTRGVSRVIHPDERVGSVANYVGRWINSRGEAGPWSHPVRMVLAMPSGQRSSGMMFGASGRREAA